MQDFRKLKVWEKAHALTVAIYRGTTLVKRGRFPGLVSQIRRSAASIPANIAEGCGYWGPRELARFLQIAMASACELEYHLILAADLGMIPQARFPTLEASTTEVKRMLASLILRVRRSAEHEKQKVVSDPEPAITDD